MRTVFSGLHCSKLFSNSQREDILHLRNIPSRKHSEFLIALNEIHCGWIIFRDSWLINKLDRLKGNESECEKKHYKRELTIQLEHNEITFTVLICIKWEWWVLSLAWNIWIAESDKKQFNTWVELILNDHCWETGEYLAVCEHLYTECASGQLRQNSRSCSSVSKDFFLFQLGLQDKAFKSLNVVFETEYLSKNHPTSHCSP